MKNKYLRYTAVIIAMLFISSISYSQADITTSNPKARKIYIKALSMRHHFSAKDFLKEMNKAIKADKRFVEPYWTIADFYKSKPQEAIKILKSAIENNVYKKDETIIKLSDIYKSTGKYKESLTALENLSESFADKSSIISNAQKILEMVNDSVPFNPKNLTYANSFKDEYFPSVTADDEIISVTSSDFGSYDANEDLYFSKKVGGKWAPFLPINELNSPNFNEGSQTISADGRYMFLVACNRPDGFGSCDIYYSINTNGRWSKPINAGLPLNSKDWESNPSLSPAGDELFFTSNRFPSFGGRDLWHCKVEMQENGILKFSDPKNMGRIINTKKDEYAPHIHSDNQTLYFISDGHLGFGGSDIFLSRKTNDQWGEPINLGYPINNADNCYGFTLTGKGDKGYISLANKEKEENGLDIYEFELNEDIRPKSINCIKGFVFDQDTKIPLNATVETFDYLSTKTLSKTLSDKQSGAFTTFLPENGEYGLNVIKSGYLLFSSKIANNNKILNIYLKPIKTGESITLNNIFFDFNSYELKEESEKEIAQLFNFLTQNHEINIEIVGHTDNIGSKDFNQTLSENRAHAVMQALIDKGISSKRLSYKGYGMSQPIADNDTEEGRDKNRRVEILIK